MATIKYIAFLDILGFKDLIENNKIEKLEELYDRLQASVMYSFAVSNPEQRLKNKKNELPSIKETNLNSLVISDSIIIWTDDDSQGSFLELILAVKYFMFFSMQSGFPLRGGISCGELLVKNGIHEKSPKFNSYTTILGLSLTRAYILENKSEWSGCVIDEKCVEHFNHELNNYKDNIANLEFFEEMDIIKRYETPMKSGEIKKYFTVNWTHFNGPRLTRSQVKKAFKAHNKSTNDWSVESKIQNTLKYLDQTKQGYKKLMITFTAK